MSAWLKGVPTFGKTRCGDCASAAATGMAAIIAGRKNLSEQDIGNAPIASDLPWLNRVEMNGAGRWIFFPIRWVHAPVLGQLRQRRLRLTRVVRATRLDHRLLSVPGPVKRKPGMRLRKHRRMTLRFPPTPAAVRGYFYFGDHACAGPRQAGYLDISSGGNMQSR